MSTVTPHNLLERHLDSLLSHLPAVRDGDVEGIHQARVATRRLREVLPLALSPFDKTMVDAVKAVGRHLGQARDVDVMRELLDEVGERDLAAVTVAAQAKRTLRQRQQVTRRAMIKGLDELDLPSLRERLGLGSSSRWLTRPFGVVRSTAWRDDLRSRIGDRAHDVVDAVGHASGIYFPNRSHGARVAIKKLRYAVEVAEDTRTWQPPRVLRDLRRIQSTLGTIHDAQVLKDAVDDLVGHDAPAAAMAALKQTLDDEIARHHGEYLRRRDRLLALCAVCERLARPRRLPSSRQLVAASAVAMPLVIWGRRQLG